MGEARTETSQETGDDVAKPNYQLWYGLLGANDIPDNSSDINVPNFVLHDKGACPWETLSEKVNRIQNP